MRMLYYILSFFVMISTSCVSVRWTRLTVNIVYHHSKSELVRTRSRTPQQISDTAEEWPLGRWPTSQSIIVEITYGNGILQNVPKCSIKRVHLMDGKYNKLSCDRFPFNIHNNTDEVTTYPYRHLHRIPQWRLQVISLQGIVLTFIHLIMKTHSHSTTVPRERRVFSMRLI